MSGGYTRWKLFNQWEVVADSGVVVFLDLRNGISVINRYKSMYEGSFTQTSNRVVNGSKVTITAPDPVSTGTSDHSLKLDVNGVTTGWGYGQFIDVDSSTVWMPISIQSWPNQMVTDMSGYKMNYNLPIFLTSQPIGSFAVDKFGNRFESYIYPTKYNEGRVVNTIAGEDAVSISKIAKPAAFYPVAPI